MDLINKTTRTILLVEDEIIIAYDQQQQLVKKGYTVLLATSSNEAINMVETNDFDLILMDIDLGEEIDGTDTAKIILKKNNIPILFLSSHIEEEIVDKTAEISSYGYVVKDTGIAVLDASIKTALNLFDALNEAKKLKTKIEVRHNEFQTALEELSVAVAIRDKNFKVILANEAALNLVEFSRERFIGSTSDETYNNSSDTEKIKALMKSKGRFENYELEIKTGKGNVKCGLLSLSTIHFEGERCYIGTITDITERKKAEHKLKRSKYELDAILQNMVDGMVMVNLKGQIIYSNTAASRILNIDKNAVTGKYFQSREWKQIDEHGNPFPLEKLPLAIALTEQRIVNNIEHPIVAEDGIWKWLAVNAAPLFDNEGKLYGGVANFSDITERKNGELELIKAKEKSEKNEAKLIEAQSATKVGSWETDLETFEVIWSEETYNIFELDFISFKASHAAFLEFVHPNDQKNVDDAFLNSMNSTTYNTFEHRIVTASGKVKHVEERWRIINNTRNEPIKAVGTCQDITERKLIELELIKAYSELENNEIKFRSYVENAPDVIFIMNETGAILDINNAASNITGYSKDQILTMNIMDFSESDIINATNVFNVLLEKGKSKGDIKFKHKNGKIKWWAMNAVKLSKNRFLGFAKDITVEKHQVLASLENEVALLQALNGKELILKEVHHRINNNMMIIASLLKMQRDSYQGNSEVVNILNDAISRIKSMSVLYNKVYRSENKRAIPIQTYLPSLIDEIIKIFPDSHKITVNTKIDDIIIKSKTLSPLGIIINELLTNSMKYAFVNCDSGLINLEVLKTNNKIVVIFEDDGIGIPEEVTLENTKGFGLKLIGLLTKQISGDVSFERNNGTRFKLEFDAH